MKDKLTIIIIIIISFGLGVWFGKSVFPSVKNPNASQIEEGFENNKSEEQDNVFTGEGEKVLGPIKLNSGLAILHAKNLTGVNDTFTVYIYKDENNDGVFQDGEGWTGDNISVGYEDAETYQGSIAFKAEEGQYFVEVDGGRWEIRVDQAGKLGSKAKIFTGVSGQGDGVTEKFFLSEGEHKFRATHDGSSNFIVYLVDENGNFTSRLVNEIGKTDLKFSYNAVFSDNYVFAVRADGNWVIEEVD